MNNIIFAERSDTQLENLIKTTARSTFTKMATHGNTQPTAKM
jgi:hypothetical protein